MGFNERHAFEPDCARIIMDVCIVLGSKSDMAVCDKCTSILDQLGVEHQVRIASAHRAPKFLEEVVSGSVEGGCKIFIGMAGLSAALPGVIASMTALPVIGVPVGGKVPFDSLLSVVQMPPGVPVAAVGVDRGDNAAVLAAQMLALGDDELADRLRNWRTSRTESVIADDESIGS